MKKCIFLRLMTLVMLLSMVLPVAAKDFYAVLSGDGNTVTFYYDDNKESRGGEGVYANPNKIYAEATKAVFDVSVANYRPSSTMTWFFECSKLTTIVGLEYLNTSEVIYMEGMFQGCSSLTSLDLTSFDTSNVTSMNGLFAYCSSLETVDLSSFNTAKVTDMGGMFAYCSSLRTIYADEARWNTAAVTGENNGNGALFYECGPLVGGNGTAYYDTYEVDLLYARIDKDGQPGYFTQKDGPAVANAEPYAVLSDYNRVLTFYYDDKKDERQNVYEIKENTQTWPSGNIRTVVFDSSFDNCYTITNTVGWFASCGELVNIQNIENLHTDNVTAMSSMFDGCSKLEKENIDLSHFNTGKVKYMVNMFANCTSLTSIDLSSFNTENVENMNSMFAGCSKLESIDLSHFNTANVKNMQRMFSDCPALTDVNVTGFNTANVTTMEGMFWGCSKLTEIDLSSFNTAAVTNMDAMFQSCSELKTIYASNKWSIESVQEGSGMFSWLENLEGGAGTKCAYPNFNYTFAHIDGGESNPGYFTQKDGSATESCDMSEIPTDNAYYAATSFLCERGVLDGSKVDGKYMVEKSLLRQHLANITFRGLFTLKGREIPSTFVSDQYPDIYDDLKSDASYYQAAKVLLYLDYGDGITPFDRDRDGFLPDGNEARINILKELMEAFNIKPDTEGTDNPFPNEPAIAQLSEASPIKMGYVRQAAKLGIITTENEQFRPYDDCLRGEAFLMLARIIQKIEAGEITDPNPQESDFLDPNSGTGTAEPYAVLSDDNTVLTFYYDNKKESRGGIDINNTYIMHGSSSPYGTATTAIFDASFANYKPTSTAYWFQRCSSLTTITGMENLKTGNVTSMECMFSYCSSLTSLVLSNFNTASVTSMSEMFYGCSGLTSLDVSNFNTANVTNMAVMFTDCSKLTSLDVSNFNTANVTDMNGMFSGCSGLTSLDLSNFNTANVTLMGSMFSGCSGLITIYVGNGWTTTSLTTGAWMFEGCTNLVGGAGTVVVEANNYKYTGESYAHIDGGESNPGYFTEKSATPVEDDSEPYAVLSNNNTVLTFYYDSKKESRGGLSAGPFKDEKDRAWNTYRESISSVVFDESFANCTTLTSTAYWFYNCSSLTGITGISNLKTDHVTDMKFMFHGCESLTSIDVSGFKTDNVENIQGMFFRCELLTSMDLSGFNTEKVTNMSALFSRCVGLTSVDLSGFKTDLVTSMRLMFNQCSSLTSLNLTDFNTGKVTDMGYMFADCSSLKTIDVSKTGWDLSQLLDGTKMFENCTSLVGGAGTKYDASHVDHTYAHIDGGTANPGYFTEKNAPVVEDNSEPYAVFDNGSGTLTFYYDEEKESRGGYDVGPFVLNEERWGGNSSYITTVVFDPSFAKCTSLTSTAYWFFECYNLTTIKGIENLKTGNVTDMQAMFYQCQSLTSLDLTTIDTRNVTDMMGMFMYCSGLTSLDLMGFNTAKVTDMNCMFRSCKKLVSLDLSNFDTSNVTNMWCMFFDCTNLEALDVSSFNTSKVTNMGTMFQLCSKLTAIDVSNFNTSSATSMEQMFDSCISLTQLDVSSFDTKNVTDFTCMFYGCKELTTIYCNDAWNSEAESSQMFDKCEKLVGGKGTTYDADHMDGSYARVDGGADAPGYFTINKVVDENVEYKFGSETELVVYAPKDDTKELYIKGTVTFDDVTYPVTSIGESAFENNTTLEEISIPATVTLFGEKAFAGCINLKAIYVYIRIPVAITSPKARTRGDGTSTVFEGVDTETCTLYVPAGSGDSYRNAEGWKEFTHIVEMGETLEVTIGKNGKTTFCGDRGLDFSYSDEVKAFIATGFDKTEGIIWMTRVKDVPAGVPVMIKGTANETYQVPVTDGGTSYYKNMFVGNTSGETISIGKTSEDGKYDNYYMSGGQFKSVNGSANIGNGKCYLQLPATFEAETTGEAIQVKIASSGKSSFAAPYDLDFTDLGDELKAFTATGYDRSTKTIWLTRVKKVQKGEGLFLKGTGGVTYTIPSAGVQSAYVNMIMGNISGETLEISETAKNGALTNYYLKGGTYMKVVGSANIGTNKSYLQLPTYMLAGARSEDAMDNLDNLGMPNTLSLTELETESMPLIFGSIGGDDDDTTGIRTTDCTDDTDESRAAWYTLGGQRISKPTKPGLYIHKGHKVVIRSTTK